MMFRVPRSPRTSAMLHQEDMAAGPHDGQARFGRNGSGDLGSRFPSAARAKRMRRRWSGP